MTTKKFLKYFVWASFFLIGANAFDMLRPLIIRDAIDHLLGVQSLMLPAIYVILCSGGAVLFWHYYNLLTIKGGEVFVENMRNTLYHHILTLPAKWHSDNQTGDIIQRCTMDVETVKAFLSDQMVQLVSMVLSIVMSACFMYGVNPTLTLICSVSVSIIIASSLLFFKKFSALNLEVQNSEGLLSTLAQENLTGVRVVRAFGREHAEQKRFSAQNEKVTNQWIHMGGIMSAYWSAMDIVSGSTMMLILAVGSYQCVKSDFTVGGLMAVVSYLVFMMRPARGLGRLISEMSKANASMTRLRAVLAAEPEKDLPGADEPPMNGDICFDHVSFAYPGQTEILHDVSFTVPAGTTLGILGNTGSGKSTLASLLARLLPLEPDQGTITVGGRDIRTMKASWVRKNTGYVLQEPFLFSKSIADNLSITNPDLSRAEIEEAAAHACLSETIAHFSKGYDTFVGERGVTLSGGQKQRTAIARTLTEKTPILIFDDSLSAVDAETDVKIRENLKKYMEDTTVILISHRITTLMAADNILVLEDGRITGFGTHEELMKKPGLYQTICQIQQGKENGHE